MNFDAYMKSSIQRAATAIGKMLEDSPERECVVCGEDLTGLNKYARSWTLKKDGGIEGPFCSKKCEKKGSLKKTSRKEKAQ